MSLIQGGSYIQILKKDVVIDKMFVQVLIVLSILKRRINC